MLVIGHVCFSSGIWEFDMGKLIRCYYMFFEYIRRTISAFKSWMNHIKLTLSCFRLTSFEAMVLRVK